MNQDVTTAVARLQARLAKASNAYREAVLEEALNRLLAKPDQTGDPNTLIATAMAAALMKLGRRKPKFQRYLGEAPVTGETMDTYGTTCVEVGHVLGKLSLRDRRVLTMAWENAGDVAAVANDLGVTKAYAGQTLSRARAAARTLWRAAA